MSRLIAASILLLAASTAAADDRVAPADMKDQAIGAAIGVGGGGRVTTGGVRILGHYLYQLSESDWFDGTATFNFGSGEPACFRDRDNDYVCDHSLVDGFSAEVAANVRRFIGREQVTQNGDVWPYLRLGVGLAIVRFADDEVTGLGIPIHAGGGLRMSVADGIAITAEATLDIGIGLFSQGLGLEPQVGGTVAAGVEFGL